MLDQESRRGLAVGAGDAGHFQFPHREPVESRAEIGQRRARVLDFNNGDARMFLSALRHDGHGAFLNRLLDEIVPVAFLAAECYEEPVFLYLAANRRRYFPLGDQPGLELGARKAR